MKTNARLALLSTVLSFGALACTAQIVGGGGSGGQGGDGGGRTGTAGGVLASPTAIALQADKLYFGNDTGGSSGEGGSATTTTGSGSGTDPTTLYLALGTTAPTCAVPGPNLPCGEPTYAVWIGIPQAMQHTGTIALDDQALTTLFNESDAPNSPA